MLLALTNEVFLCALFFMLDVLNAWALISQAFQITKRCVALQDHNVEACIAELDRIVKWEGEEWRQFNDALVLREGSNTRFYGFLRHNSSGRSEFTSQAVFTFL